MLTTRQQTILKAIVRQYTETGQPVGSKVLTKHLPMKVSSATVRNEMAVLEHAGLIKKEHSSSGRLPSKKGYRYYVDHLLDPNAVTENDLIVIKNSLGGETQKLDKIVAHSADLLSQLTSYTTFTLKPEQRHVHLSGFRVVPLGNQKVLAILVTDSGDVESQAFTIPRDTNREALEEVIRLMNDQLVGLPITEVSKRLKTDIPAQITKYLQSPEGFLEMFDSVLSDVAHEHFFVGGRLNLLGFSGSRDPDTLQALYRLLDQSDSLTSLIEPHQTEDDDKNPITVKIGDEITDNKLLKDYSLITATYDVDQYGKGIIAVLGPTRMPYSRTIGLVQAFRGQLTKRLLDYYHDLYDS